MFEWKQLKLSVIFVLLHDIRLANRGPLTSGFVIVIYIELFVLYLQKKGTFIHCIYWWLIAIALEFVLEYVLVEYVLEYNALEYNVLEYCTRICTKI